MKRLDVVDPVLPAWYDAAFAVIGAAMLVWWASAIISIARRAPSMRAWEAIAWFLFVTVAPVVGPFAWFLLARQPALRDGVRNDAVAGDRS
ncbi:phospholipase D-like protein [Microcella putealis]|uniref:Phospholipase D-like protein n=1 Tax=Microcella putealis TaxID=337005 RepID=A0A4Q7LWT4_9MICO|nr:PLDc N-terminal domain-containing protein [Microcella putealis]RZS58922.1 phospholipase D-like protein [Microcella putealis]TQM23948.1 phospholipase D-like protein [Microcella putealis]